MKSTALILRLSALSQCLLLAALAMTASAQTAHPSGAVNTLYKGQIHPKSFATDTSNNVYYADPVNNRVVELLAVNGVIPANPTRIVVTGSNPAFNAPTAIALDSSNNVYVVDQGNKMVRVIVAAKGAITASSQVVTAISSGLHVPTGLVWDNYIDEYGKNSGQYLYVSDQGDNSVKLYTAASLTSFSYKITTTWSGFNAPSGIATDHTGNAYAGIKNIYVADTNNGAIEDIANDILDSNYTTIFTIATGFASPTSVTVDASGDLYVVDDNGSTIYAIPSNNGGVTVDSPMTVLTTLSNSIYDIGIDTNNNLYMSGSAGGSAGSIQMLETGAANFGTLGLSTHSAVMLIPFHFDSPGKTKGWAVLTGGATGKDFIEIPAQTTCSTTTSYNAGDTCSVAVRFTPARVGLRTGAVQMVDATGAPMATALLRGVGNGAQLVFPNQFTPKQLGSGFNWPNGIAVDANGNVYVADTGNNAIKQIVAVNGSIPANPTIRTLATGITNPKKLVLDGGNNLYVSDLDFNGSIGIDKILAVKGQIPSNPTLLHFYPNCDSDFALDGYGNLLCNVSGIQVYSPVLGSIPQNPTAYGWGLPMPAFGGLAVDANENIFANGSVADGYYTIEAVFISNSTDGQLPFLSGSLSSTPLYDGKLNSVLTLDNTGNIYSFSNSGTAVDAYIPVNGHPTSTMKPFTLGSGLNQPVQLTVDNNNNVYVADQDGVKEIMMGTPPMVNFPTPTLVGSTDTQDGPISFKVANNGTSKASFPAPATGFNPSISGDFSWDSASTCKRAVAGGAAVTLSAGASCTVVLDFKPTAGGSRAGTLVFTDNAASAAGTPQVVHLSGVGLTAAEVGVPTISPATGSYKGEQTVTITEATAGARIHFTLDGSNPTANSPLYEFPFLLPKTTTVKAIGVKAGLANSRVAVSTITVK